MPHETIPTGDGGRVVFGAGIRFSVESEIERIGARKALVLATAQQCDAAL